eukprot:Phypoly_transcript_04360.p1 GENE.Phypoly_transcript_04360~~Phypoly_transcript_04360.p1  ORF type:complete len:583 (+),score=97.82 Phypoly_transcript_04360:87-1751(+)
MTGLIISILVFSFFAFVFATASFAATKNLNSGVSNNFYNQQGGLIQDTYSVAAGTRTFEAGTVLSYCDNNSPVGGVCPGLGPRWNETLYPRGSLSPATLGDLVQISDGLAVYVSVVPSAPNVLRIAAITTGTSPPDYTANPTLLTLSDPISWLAVRAFSATGVVVAYNIHNSSFIVAASVSQSGPVQFGTPVNMFEVTLTNDGFPIDILVLNYAYVLVSYGPNSSGAAFLAYTLDGTNLNPITVAKNSLGFQITNVIASVYLGTNYFLYATGNMAVLGTFTFAGNTLTLSSQKTLAFTNVLFESLTATSLFNGYIALAGVQTELLQVALTISMVLQWSTTPPYIAAFFPNNLLESQGHQLVNNQLSVCYAPSSTGEPKGELFFAYVDSISDRGKIVRAKIAVTTSQDVQILPSPPIDISTFTYTQFGTAIGPLVACPSPTGVLVGIQYLGTYFNSFIWEGGYRFAGIAQESYESGSAKTGVRVMRQGISDVHTQLQPGFPYYMSNSGHLHAHASIVEMFSSASFNTPVGVALTDKQLLLDANVFEHISREGGGN